MKKFCRCNGKWVTNYCDYDMHNPKYTNYSRLIVSTETVNNHPCDTIYYWYNADYENMMFDLKEMNKQ